MTIVRFHPHALARIEERGTSKEEVELTVQEGEQFPAKFGRTGFRRNFVYEKKWRDKIYQTKQVEAYAVDEEGWLVITVVVKFF